MRSTDRRPRQRLGAESRRAAILRAAGEAFAAQPYPRVSVAEIVAAAGASEALVHRYFGSKSALYVAVVRFATDRLLERQRAADAALGPGATPRERLAESIRVYLAAIQDWSVGWTSRLNDPAGEPGAGLSKKLTADPPDVNCPGKPSIGANYIGYLGNNRML